MATLLAGAATAAWQIAGSTALATRLVVAVAFIGMIALLLEQMAGHAWQLDVHMYFFAALAVLAVYCDPLVLVFAAGADGAASPHPELSARRRRSIRAALISAASCCTP